MFAMIITPYLYFNGDCAEAIELYKKAFGGESRIMRYKDAPPSESGAVPPGVDELVMHGALEFKDQMLYLCDGTPDMKTSFGDALQIHANMDSPEAAQKAYDILKEGGTVTMPLEKVFWAELFSSLTDKFGVNWMITYDTNPRG
jgi:PhnB protein